jgi:putative heme-binding domain-containing protein
MGQVVRRVTTHYAQGVPADPIVGTLRSLEGAPLPLAEAILEGLRAGWPQGRGPALGPQARDELSGLMKKLPESVRDLLLTLAQRWGQPELFGESIAAIVDSLKRRLTDTASDDVERASAARRLIALDDQQETIELVLKQITLLAPPALATGLIQSLADSRNTNTGPVVMDAWSRFTPAVRRAAIAVLSRRTEGAMALLDAVQAGRIPKTDLAPEHWSQLKQNPNRAVARRADRLSEINATVSGDREAIVKSLIPLASQPGDGARGKEVFIANCAVCHALAGEGGKVGPDLTGIHTRDRAEILQEILDPNRSVEANYRLWNVTTADGDTFSGRLDAETQTTVEILDTTAQRHVIQRKDISSIDASSISIMPTGFEALPAADLTALLEYLAQPSEGRALASP